LTEKRKKDRSALWDVIELSKLNESEIAYIVAEAGLRAWNLSGARTPLRHITLAAEAVCACYLLYVGSSLIRESKVWAYAGLTSRLRYDESRLKSAIMERALNVVVSRGEHIPRYVCFSDSPRTVLSSSIMGQLTRLAVASGGEKKKLILEAIQTSRRIATNESELVRELYWQSLYLGENGVYIEYNDVRNIAKGERLAECLESEEESIRRLRAEAVLEPIEILPPLLGIESLDYRPLNNLYTSHQARGAGRMSKLTRACLFCPRLPSNSMVAWAGVGMKGKCVTQIGAGRGGAAAANLLNGALVVMGIDLRRDLPVSPKELGSYLPPLVASYGFHSQYSQLLDLTYSDGVTVDNIEKLDAFLDADETLVIDANVSGDEKIKWVRLLKPGREVYVRLMGKSSELSEWITEASELMGTGAVCYYGEAHDDWGEVILAGRRYDSQMLRCEYVPHDGLRFILSSDNLELINDPLNELGLSSLSLPSDAFSEQFFTWETLAHSRHKGSINRYLHLLGAAQLAKICPLTPEEVMIKTYNRTLSVKVDRAMLEYRNRIVSIRMHYGDEAG
jgi:hypothetical protein